MFLSLLKSLDLSLGICCLTLVTKCYLDFFNKFISILSIFFSFYLIDLILCIYFCNTSLIWANTIVILLLIAITLLLLRNKWISLHQSLNFIWSPSNYHGSETILFDITAYSNTASVSTDSVGIFSGVSSSVVLFLSKIYFLVILNNLSISSNASMFVLWCCQAILFVCEFYYNNWFLFSILSIVFLAIICVAVSSDSLTVCLWFHYKVVLIVL